MGPKESNVSEALARLYGRRRFGMKPGLAVERALLELLGNPQTSYPCIHVADTNGKGSTAAMIAAILQAAGYKTGLYTSPHLVRFNERFCVDGEAIDDRALSDLVQDVEIAAERIADAGNAAPTFFECSTAIAFLFFQKAKVDIAVVETGLGGRLDATNVVTPALAVITAIGIEHGKYLGSTLEQIAEEKGGVIKPGCPVVCGPMEEAARDTIRSIADANKSPFISAEENVRIRSLSVDPAGQKLEMETQNDSYGRIAFPLQGAHQLENLASAVTAVEVLADLTGGDVGVEAVKKGLSHVRWPGRFQIIDEAPYVVVDGAHNPSAAMALRKTLDSVMKNASIGLIIGMCSDKDVAGFLKVLRDRVGSVWAVPIENERSMDPKRIVGIAGGLGLNAGQAEVSDALVDARTWAKDGGGVVCVTGSLFLVGQVLREEGLL